MATYLELANNALAAAPDASIQAVVTEPFAARE